MMMMAMVPMAGQLQDHEGSDGCCASDFDSIFGEDSDHEQSYSPNRVNRVGLALEDELQADEPLHDWVRDLSSGCGRPDLEEEHGSEDGRQRHDMEKARNAESGAHQTDAQVDGIAAREEDIRPEFGKAGEYNVTGSITLSEIRTTEFGPSHIRTKIRSSDRNGSLEAQDKMDPPFLDVLGDFFPSSSNEATLSGGQKMKHEPFGIDEEFKGLNQKDDIGLVEVPVLLKKGPACKDSVNSDEELGPDELSRYVEALDVKESYIDTVLDMESVLLETEGDGRRFWLMTNMLQRNPDREFRNDDSSTSSSGMSIMNASNTSTVSSIPMNLDIIEVIGARQVRGGASLKERMVGVKDHTVYCINVRSNGREWKVERRYHDFVDLYHRLKNMLYAQNSLHLPTCWQEIEKESRKVFGGNSPNIMEHRSILIQRCLMSLLQAGSPFNIAPPLFWFLNPTGSSNKSSSEPLETQSSVERLPHVQLDKLASSEFQPLSSDVDNTRKAHNNNVKSNPAFGKTIGLVLRLHPKKTVKQLLQAQQYSCAGCYKRLDVANSLMQGLVQKFGWGKPRLCEYSGQLFCTSCHLNETAVLPAHVLQHWDFASRKVSQFAKAYLDSIYDQPMLCVSAVNPYLYSKVPILAHAIELRRKLSKLIYCIQCPLRARLQQTLGSRRYLLENNDFFALKDLEDLSKGAFAVLPGLMKDLCEKLTIHVLQQCSLCLDVGEWCGAGFLCEDPFSPIFPFQETAVTSCQICNMKFHKSCFEKCSSCPSCKRFITG